LAHALALALVRARLGHGRHVLSAPLGLRLRLLLLLLQALAAR
jgi:hypothetical protein